LRRRGAAIDRRAIMTTRCQDRGRCALRLHDAQAQRGHGAVPRARRRPRCAPAPHRERASADARQPAQARVRAARRPRAAAARRARPSGAAPDDDAAHDATDVHLALAGSRSACSHAKPDTLLRIYAQDMQRDRAKIGSAFDALMAGAALPPETAIGPMGQIRLRPRQTRRPRVSKKEVYFPEAAEGTRTLDLLHGKQCWSRAEEARNPRKSTFSRQLGARIDRPKIAGFFVRLGQ
jgi:hypothetical protein